MATLCCCPPDSWEGMARAVGKADGANASTTRAPLLGRYERRDLNVLRAVVVIEVEILEDEADLLRPDAAELAVAGGATAPTRRG